MLYESQNGDMTMALTGESLITRGLKPFREERFLKLVDMLQRADLTFTNGEMLFHDYEGTPCEESGGTHMRCDPRFLEDLKWIGIDMAACAMNHAFDYMETGVLVNKANLDKYRIVNAGTGRNMTLARTPSYLDTPKGRVALLSATDHLNVPAARAGEERPEIKGRPGANMIRVQSIYTVDQAIFDQLRQLDAKLGFDQDRQHARAGRFPIHKYHDTEAEFYFGPGIGGGRHPSILFRLGDAVGRTTVADSDDWQDNLKWIRDARRMADWVLFSLHCGYRGATADDPPDHLVQLAHEAIDNGVDVFIGHGPHRDKGIEIYKGKPIFYSLGDFILQNDTPVFQPADAYARYGLDGNHTPSDFYFTRSRDQSVAQDINRENWQSAVARLNWQHDRQLKEIELHPIDLGIGLPIGQRGRPVLAEGEIIDEVLDRFQRCSDRFHTQIDKQNGMGVIHVM
jgi:poly-gamma-glutamate synthesis protein (capsule biosynthesis protein)